MSEAKHMERNPQIMAIAEAWANYNGKGVVTDRELATVKRSHDLFMSLASIFLGTQEGLLHEAIRIQGQRIDDLIHRRS